MFLAGAVITTFLSNDATALILTPVANSVATRLRLPPLPYLVATTFVADSASITLPVSNPINILVVDRIHLGLGPYVGHLLATSLIAVAVNAALFLLGSGARPTAASRPTGDGPWPTLCRTRDSSCSLALDWPRWRPVTWRRRQCSFQWAWLPPPVRLCLGCWRWPLATSRQRAFAPTSAFPYLCT